eukprot:5035669-Prymnesium_polylepis.1
MSAIRQPRQPCQPGVQPQGGAFSHWADTCNVASREKECTKLRGDTGDFEKLQPCKSDYTTSQNTYQTCPKRPR